MTPAFLVIDKEPGITSHDVVAMVRAVLGIKKVGHTGTLDPFATGVLPLALGPATKLIQYLDEDLKVYDATIQLGAATTTGDPEGEVDREAPVPELEPAAVQRVLDGFQGDRMQRPPRHSAVKVDGRRLYKYAREGKDVQADPRPIRIDSIELLDHGDDWLRVLISCGRGTYARVLADEIAVELGSAGHLTALRRRRSGPFTLDQALKLPQLSRIVADRDDWRPVLRPARGQERVQWNPRPQVREGVRPWLVSPEQALVHLPRAAVPETLRNRVANGASVPPAPADTPPGQPYVVVCGDELLAIARQEEDGPRPLRVVARPR